MTFSGSAKDIWEVALGELQIQLSKPNYETWLKDTTGVSLQGKTFKVGTPRPFAVAWLENHLGSLINKTLVNITGQDLAVQFVVLSAQGKASSSPTPRMSARISTEPATELCSARPNPRYTFSSFTIGDCNRLACAAAMGVAEEPGFNYNPLFIHSKVGLGKTHLLHAIGNSAAGHGFQVLCASTEQFTNEFIEAIRGKETAAFRSKFRSPDLLLIDDLHFISGKERTQESFYHTFNELYDSNRQIVVTSDRAPRALPTLGEQLISRFEGGLVVTLQPPDFKTRVSILQTKAKEQQLPLFDEAVEFLANRYNQNIRELEGAFHQVSAYARLTRTQSITVEVVQQALFDVQKTAAPRESGLASLAAAVANYYNLSVDDLTGRKRLARVRQARQLAMFLAREESLASLTRIGEFFGGRDHSTVLQSCQRASAEIDRDPNLRQQLSNIRGIFHPKA